MTGALRWVAILGLAAVLSASCSPAAGNAAAGAEAAGGSSDQAARFAQCMREHGIKQFPDPDASGNLTIETVANGSSIDTNGAAFKQASAACKDLQPAGFVGHKRTAEEQQQALKFAQCVRDNGVKDFPDPAPDGPLIDTTRMPGNPNARSIPGLQAAMQKCREFAANAGVTGAP